MDSDLLSRTAGLSPVSRLPASRKTPAANFSKPRQASILDSPLPDSFLGVGDRNDVEAKLDQNHNKVAVSKVPALNLSRIQALSSSYASDQLTPPSTAATSSISSKIPAPALQASTSPSPQPVGAHGLHAASPSGSTEGSMRKSAMRRASTSPAPKIGIIGLSPRQQHKGVKIAFGRVVGSAAVASASATTPAGVRSVRSSGSGLRSSEPRFEARLSSASPQPPPAATGQLGRCASTSKVRMPGPSLSAGMAHQQSSGSGNNVGGASRPASSILNQRSASVDKPRQVLSTSWQASSTTPLSSAKAVGAGAAASTLDRSASVEKVRGLTGARPGGPAAASAATRPTSVGRGVRPASASLSTPAKTAGGGSMGSRASPSPARRTSIGGSGDSAAAPGFRTSHVAGGAGAKPLAAILERTGSAAAALKPSAPITANSNPRCGTQQSLVSPLGGPEGGRGIKSGSVPPYDLIRPLCRPVNLTLNLSSLKTGGISPALSPEPQQPAAAAAAAVPKLNLRPVIQSRDDEHHPPGGQAQPCYKVAPAIVAAPSSAHQGGGTSAPAPSAPPPVEPVDHFYYYPKLDSKAGPGDDLSMLRESPIDTLLW